RDINGRDLPLLRRRRGDEHRRGMARLVEHQRVAGNTQRRVHGLAAVLQGHRAVLQLHVVDLDARVAGHVADELSRFDGGQGAHRVQPPGRAIEGDRPDGDRTTGRIDLYTGERPCDGRERAIGQRYVVQRDVHVPDDAVRDTDIVALEVDGL